MGGGHAGDLPLWEAAMPATRRTAVGPDDSA